MNNKLIPLDFNWKNYIKYNSDLNGLNRQQAIEHWINHGRFENRQWKRNYRAEINDGDLILPLLQSQLNRFSKSDNSKPIWIFYHIYAENHWKEIMDEQINNLHSSGLFDKSEKLFFSIIADESTFEFIKNNYYHEKIVFVKSENKFEFSTIDLMRQQSEKADFNGLYLHTKSSSSPKPELYKDTWRKIMNFYNIDLWKYCINALDTFDIVGCNFRSGNISIGEYWHSYYRRLESVNHPSDFTDHFSGNFWWFNSTYLRKLNYLTLQEKSNRFNAEFWVFRGWPKYWNWISLMNISFDSDSENKIKFLNLTKKFKEQLPL